MYEDDEEATKIESLSDFLGGDTNLEAARAADGAPMPASPQPPTLVSGQINAAQPRGHVQHSQHAQAAPMNQRTPPHGYPPQEYPQQTRQSSPGFPTPPPQLRPSSPGFPTPPPQQPRPSSGFPTPPPQQLRPSSPGFPTPPPQQMRPSSPGFPTPPPQQMRSSSGFPTPPPMAPAHGYPPAQHQMQEPHHHTPAPHHHTPSHPFPVVERPSSSFQTPSPYGGPGQGGDPGTNTKLASLAALSLDKNNVQSATSSSNRGGSSKLPWVLLVLAVAGGGYYMYTTKDKPAATASTPDKTGSGGVISPTPKFGLTAAGYLAARDPIVLSATSTGRLEKVLVKNGDRIKKGQLLAALDAGHLRAKLSRENVRVRDAQRALQRTKKLVKLQAATQLDLDKAIGAVDIASAEARVVAQELKETQIHSPIDGTVLEVLVRPGESLSQSAPVLRIADVSALVAEVNVSEADLKQISPGQNADVTTDSQRDKTFTGTVREIAQQADRARGTVLVKVNVEATPESNLRPGMAIQVRFKPREEMAPAGSGVGSGTAAASAGSAGSAAVPANK